MLEHLCLCDQQLAVGNFGEDAFEEFLEQLHPKRFSAGLSVELEPLPALLPKASAFLGRAILALHSSIVINREIIIRPHFGFTAGARCR